MAVKKGLGRGIDNLIPNRVQETGTYGKNVSRETSAKPARPDKLVKISKIEPRPDQPRQEFDKKALAELAESIRKFGVVQPLLVVDRGKYFELVAGERRWRAARMAGLKEVPVIVRDFTDREIVEISLIENIQREDLNPLEEAEAYKKLSDEFGLKQGEIAESVSKSRAAVANSMRLLALPGNIQKLVASGKLSAGHARTLVPIKDQAVQEKIARNIIENDLSVRQTEELVKNVLENGNKKTAAKKSRAAQKDSHDSVYEQVEENLREILGTDVRINRSEDGRGKVEIVYYSVDELERIIELISKIKK